MLIISSLTLLISISPLFVAAHLDPRSQEEKSFVTVPLVKGSNLTLPNGVLTSKLPDVLSWQLGALTEKTPSILSAVHLLLKIYWQL